MACDGALGSWAVKLGKVEGAAVVARESAVMECIGGLVPSTSYGKRAEWGRSETVAWLMTPWLNGPSTWQIFQPVRDKGAARRYGALHRAGQHGGMAPRGEGVVWTNDRARARSRFLVAVEPEASASSAPSPPALAMI